MPQNVVVVDAFTDTPFAGNPAAVCVLDAPADEAWMRAVAREMNLSETAFLYPEGGESRFRLRWLTPAVEVDLCGHATLAAAHVLWEDGRCDAARPIAFETRSGRLQASRSGDWIELNFPTLTTEPIEAPVGFAAALGLDEGVALPFVGRTRFDILVALDDESMVRELRPDFGALKRQPVRGIIVTAPGNAGGSYDFVSRFFAPASGIDEDPVTGSAHSALGRFWAERLGRNELEAYQASPRGGVVRIRVAGDRTILGGQAVTVMRGTLLA